MGSAADLNFSDEALKFAKNLGKLIAQSGNILVYGAKKLKCISADSPEDALEKAINEINK
jgi:hypothetical protein